MGVRYQPFGLGTVSASTAAVQSLVASTASSYGVDPSLALAVAQAESNFNQAAVSYAGAIGVMQLMPSTAAALGVDPTSLQGNVQGGVQYLAQMLNMFGGNVAEALAAYNWGPGHVNTAIAAYGGNWLANAPAATQAYVATITGAMGAPVTDATLQTSTADASAADGTDAGDLSVDLPTVPDNTLYPPFNVAEVWLLGGALILWGAWRLG